MLFCFPIEVNPVGETVLGPSKLKQTHGQRATEDCEGCLCIYTGTSQVTYSQKSATHLPPKNRQQKSLGYSMNFRDKHQHCSERGYSFLPTCFILRSCKIFFYNSPSAVLEPVLSSSHFCNCLSRIPYLYNNTGNSQNSTASSKHLDLYIRKQHQLQTQH